MHRPGSTSSNSPPSLPVTRSLKAELRKPPGHIELSWQRRPLSRAVAFESMPIHLKLEKKNRPHPNGAVQVGGRGGEPGGPGPTRLGWRRRAVRAQHETVTVGPGPGPAGRPPPRRAGWRGTSTVAASPPARCSVTPRPGPSPCPGGPAAGCRQCGSHDTVTEARRSDSVCRGQPEWHSL